MAAAVKGQRGYIIEVQGFSSGKGQTAIATSQKMAESVVRYLVLNHEIPVYRIYLVGMGNAPVQAVAADERKAEADQRWTRRSQPPEEQPGAALQQQRSPHDERRPGPATEIVDCSKKCLPLESLSRKREAFLIVS